MKKIMTYLFTVVFAFSLLPSASFASANVRFTDFSPSNISGWEISDTNVAKIENGVLNIKSGDSTAYQKWKLSGAYPSGEVVVEYDFKSASSKATVFIDNPKGGSVCRLQQIGKNIQLQHGKNDATGNENTLLTSNYSLGSLYHIKHVITYRDNTVNNENRTTSSVYIYDEENNMVGSAVNKIYMNPEKYLSATELRIIQIVNQGAADDTYISFDNFAVYENNSESIIEINKQSSRIDISSIIDGDIALTTRSYGGAVITWESSNENIISSGGAVKLPSKQTTVNLIEKITYNGETAEVIYPITVAARSVWKDYLLNFDDNILPNGFTKKTTEGFCGVKDGALVLERPADTVVNNAPQMTADFSKMPWGILNSEFVIEFDFTSDADKNSKVYFQAVPNTGSLIRIETIDSGRIQFVTGGNGDSAVSTKIYDNTFLQGKTYHIKVEFDWNRKKCSIYIDEKTIAAEHNFMPSECPGGLSTILFMHGGETGKMTIDNLVVRKLLSQEEAYLDKINYSVKGDSISVSGTVCGAEDACVISAIYDDNILCDIKMSNDKSFELNHNEIDFGGYSAKLLVLDSTNNLKPMTAAYETNEREIKTFATINDRKKLVVEAYRNNVYPDPNSTNNPQIGKIGLALSLLYLGKDFAGANELLTECLNVCDATLGENSGIYFQMPLLARIYICYEKHLTDEVKKKIEDFFYDYLCTYEDISRASDDFVHKESGFLIENTGNHHLIKRLAYLLGHQILKNSPNYKDGLMKDSKSPGEHYNAWLSYMLEEIPYRIKYTPEIEYFASGYGKYTLDVWFTLYDAAENEQLRQLCRKYLDYLTADMTVQSVNGIYGGARGRSVRTDEMISCADFYLNMIFYGCNSDWFLKNSFDPVTGEILNTTSNVYFHPNLMSLATSGYLPPFILENIALSEKAPYEYVSYPSGRGNRSSIYDAYFEVKNPGRYLRYSYVTPTYTVGSMTYDRALSYTEIQQQNRYVGIHFKKPGDNSSLLRVYPDTERNYYRGYNDINAAASKTAMLVSSLPEAKYYNPAEHRDIKVAVSKIFYDNHIISDGWMFSYSDDLEGYIAIKPSKGAIEGWENTDSLTPYLLFDTVNIPIVMQAGSRSEHGSFENFMREVKKTDFYWASNTEFVYKPIYDGETISFFTDTTVHKVGGKDIALESAYLVESPFLTSLRTSGKVLINNLNNASLILDFNKED